MYLWLRILSIQCAGDWFEVEVQSSELKQRSGRKGKENIIVVLFEAASTITLRCLCSTVPPAGVEVALAIVVRAAAVVALQTITHI